MHRGCDYILRVVISIIRVSTNKQTSLGVKINMLNYFKVLLSISKFDILGRFNQLSFYCRRRFGICLLTDQF